MSITDTQEALDLLKQDRTDEAIAVLERQVAYLPAHVVAHVMLARAYEVKKEWGKALEAWENARFLVPNSPIVRKGKQRVVSKLAVEEPSVPVMHPEASSEAAEEGAVPVPAAEPAEASAPLQPQPEAEDVVPDAETAEDAPPIDVEEVDVDEAPVRDETSRGRRETIRLGAGQVAYVKPDSMEIKLSTPVSKDRPAADEASDTEEAESVEADTENDAPEVASEAPAADTTPEEGPSTQVFSWEGLPPEESAEAADEQGVDEPTTGAAAAEEEKADGEAADDEEPVPRGPKTGDLDRLIRDLESARIEPDPDLDDIPPPDLDDDIEDLVSETLARIYTAQGQYREAARIYVKLASQDPDQARQHLEKAAELRERADNEEQ